jgi:hypothetical protein
MSVIQRLNVVSDVFLWSTTLNRSDPQKTWCFWFTVKNRIHGRIERIIFYDVSFRDWVQLSLPDPSETTRSNRAWVARLEWLMTIYVMTRLHWTLRRRRPYNIVIDRCERVWYECMKYGPYRMLCALALTRFPNWARRSGSQELAKSSRRINGMLTGRLLLIHLSGRISKNVERVTRKEVRLSESIRIIPYHLKWPDHRKWPSVSIRSGLDAIENQTVSVAWFLDMAAQRTGSFETMGSESG